MYTHLKEYLNNNLEILENGYTIISLKKKHQIFYQEIFEIPLFKENGFRWKEIVFCVNNDIKELKLCIVCKSKKAIFYNIQRGYSRICSIICSRRDPEWKKKVHTGFDYKTRSKTFKETCLKKYGVENPSQLSDIKKKKKETCLTNYGVDHPLKVKEIIEIVSQKNRDNAPETVLKQKETNLKKYGTEYYTQTVEFKSAMQDIWVNGEYKKKHSDRQKQYHIDNPEARFVVGEKVSKNWANKSSEERKILSDIFSKAQKEVHSNPQRSKEIIQKGLDTIVKNTPKELLKELNIDLNDPNAGYEIRQYLTEQITFEKYGVKTVFSLPHIQEKCKISIKEKYDVDNISQHISFKQSHRRRSDLNISNIFSIDFNIIEVFRDSDDYKNSFIKLECKECKKIFKRFIHGVPYDSIRCPQCSSKLNNLEKIIQNMLTEKNIEYSIMDRRVIAPSELDFYIEKSKLAIEVNGMYWHSDLFIDSNYHYQKYLKCKNNNVKLIQFFEDDILSKPDIIKSIIYNNLDIFKKIIHGRKCKIKEISSKEKNDFLTENHLMGNDNAKIKLGSFFENKLVAVMTFNKGNITIQKSIPFDWELSRYCSKKFYKIHGIVSKLFKYFLNTQSKNIKIVTFASLMIGDGNVYKKLGFDILHTTAPGYFYTKGLKRFHRFKGLSLRKNKALTERDDMYEQGYLKVYDAGNNKFLF